VLDAINFFKLNLFCNFRLANGFAFLFLFGHPHLTYAMHFTKSSSLLALSLSAASMAQTVVGPTNAASVSTLEFKNRFQASGIVPEVIAALDPSVSFYASYKRNDGQDELLVPGTALTIQGK
jgi:hypothetical protein